MSKLVSRIEKISRGSPAPMGFGAATRAAQTPAMALIGILSQNSLEEAKSLASLDADGALLTGIDSGEEIASIAEALGSTPWGVRADALDGETADGLVQKGCDFFLVNPESVTVEAAKDDRAAFILSIPIGANDGFLRTLEDLPISAAFTSLADNGPLTLQRLIDVVSVRTMFDKYPARGGSSRPLCQGTRRPSRRGGRRGRGRRGIRFGRFAEGPERAPAGTPSAAEAQIRKN